MSSFDRTSAQEPLNPYAAPLTDVGFVPSDLDVDHSEAEAVRRLYLNHEASVKSLGSLHYLGAFFGTLAVVIMLVTFVASDRGEELMLGLLVVAVYGVMTGVNYALGYGLRRLQPWARWTETAFFLFGLLGTVAMIIGILVTGNGMLAGPSIIGITIYPYVLYLLLSPKGAMVFSPDYKAIIANTPHVKYKTSWIVKLALALFLGVIGLAFIAGMISAIVSKP